MTDELARVPIRELASNPETVFDRVAQGESVIVVDTAGKDVAIVKPLRLRRRGRRKTAADLAAFRAAAGGWADVDTDGLIETLYESRRSSPRNLAHFERIPEIKLYESTGR